MPQMCVEVFANGKSRTRYLWTTGLQGITLDGVVAPAARVATRKGYAEKWVMLGDFLYVGPFIERPSGNWVKRDQFYYKFERIADKCDGWPPQKRRKMGA